MDECMKLLIEQNQGLNDELIRVRADAYRMEMENFHLKR